MPGAGHAGKTILDHLGDEWEPIAGGTSPNECASTCGPRIEESGHPPRPWTLVEADAVRGAGADWVDEEVVDTDGPGPLISSRKRDDLPAFTQAVAEAF